MSAKRNSNGTFNSNAEIAFQSYVQWLLWYPQDYKGATEAASDFIDTEEDLNELENIIKEKANL